MYVVDELLIFIKADLNITPESPLIKPGLTLSGFDRYINNMKKYMGYPENIWRLIREIWQSDNNFYESTDL